MTDTPAALEHAIFGALIYHCTNRTDAMEALARTAGHLIAGQFSEPERAETVEQFCETVRKQAATQSTALNITLQNRTK